MSPLCQPGALLGSWTLLGCPHQASAEGASWCIARSGHQPHSLPLSPAPPQMTASAFSQASPWAQGCWPTPGPLPGHTHFCTLATVCGSGLDAPPKPERNCCHTQTPLPVRTEAAGRKPELPGPAQRPEPACACRPGTQLPPGPESPPPKPEAREPVPGGVALFSDRAGSR